MKRYGEVVVEKRNVFSPIMFGSFLAIFLCDMYQRFTNSFITQFMIYSQQWKPNKIKEKPPKRKSVAFKVKLVELRFFSFSSQLLFNSKTLIVNGAGVESVYAVYSHYFLLSMLLTFYDSLFPSLRLLASAFCTTILLVQQLFSRCFCPRSKRNQEKKTIWIFIFTPLKVNNGKKANTIIHRICNKKSQA